MLNRLTTLSFKNRFDSVNRLIAIPARSYEEDAIVQILEDNILPDELIVENS